jgi:prepilin-type processing-associated H-X9-DG protein/prepilin-type N-terminal cleavage/methylation domain-containing protein
MKRGAFTLVELLLVMAVIALIMGLLLAAVDSARAQGDSAQCHANLHQLAAANFAYAADNNGQFVAAQEPSNLIRWHGARDSVDAQFDPTKGPLSPYLGKEGRVKLCPALRNVLTGSQSFESGTGGYGYNAAYIGGTPMDIWTPERLSRLDHAAQTVMFTDTAFPRSDGLQEYAYCEAWSTEYPLNRFRGKLSASVHFRHAGKANVAWCDGHVSSEAPSQLDGGNGYGGSGVTAKVGWFGPSAMNGYWRPY